MIVYNSKEWFGLIFQFHKSDTFRKLLWVMVSIAGYAAGTVYLEFEILGLNPKASTITHSLLGFVISLLLVFRTNTAYDRWWEGRKQWGALVNVSRNLSMKLAALSPSVEQARLLEGVAYYASLLRYHLRHHPVDKLREKAPSWCPVAATHVPNAVAADMQKQLLALRRNGQVSEGEYMVMATDVNAFTDICGACERIKKTPIPYTYNLFIKKFIFVYIISMPFALAGDLRYWTVLVTVFTFYTLASLEMIAENIEDPFGTDTDDLPTDDIAETIAKNVREIRELAI